MVVICEGCGKIYHVDPCKLKLQIKNPNGIQIKCKACEHTMTLRAPDEGSSMAQFFPEEGAVAVVENQAPVIDVTSPKRHKRNPCKGLGLRTKMFFLFLLIPILLFIGMSAFSQYQMLTLANSITLESSDVVGHMAEEIIINKARSVALQCSIFLRNNPDLPKADFYSNSSMREIAVQKVGTKGFTALIEIPSQYQTNETGYNIWFHRNKTLIGTPLFSRMKEELGLGYPSFDKVFRAMKGGRKIKGYYRAVSEEGKEDEKFMAVEPIEGTPYLILSTTAVKDFTGPIQLIEKRATRLTRAAQKMTLAFIGGGLLFMGLSIMVYGYRLTSDIQRLTDATDRISVGDLDVSIDIHSYDEIGSLAKSVVRIQENLRFSIESLSKKP